MGCLPMFLQVPVFISLFRVLRRLDPTRERMTELYTWTHDQFIDASLATLFNAPIASRFFDDASTASLTWAPTSPRCGSSPAC